MRPPYRLLALAALAVFSACRQTVDLSQKLQVLDVSTGWYDAGIVNGQNKLVPSITVKVKNTSGQKLVMLQVNALFRHGNDQDEWGSAFTTVSGSDGLPAGATTPPIVLKSQQGYTSEDPRQQMLHNSHFVDAKVLLTAKYGSTQWSRIGEYTVERRLITQ